MRLYNWVCPSIRRLVRRSVCRSVALSSKTREIDIFVQIVKKNHVIMSSCNDYISKGTHRWPYGPCLQWDNSRMLRAIKILHSD